MRNTLLKISILFLLIPVFVAEAQIPNLTSESTFVLDAIQESLKSDPAEDDPAFYDRFFEKEDKYKVKASKPFWLIPSNLIPKDVDVQASNNNVTIARFKDKVYLGFRTSKTHFASTTTHIYIISSQDGLKWDTELKLAFGRDIREPMLLVTNDTLRFYYFLAGAEMTTFKPEKINMIYKTSGKDWSVPEIILDEGEVHWSMKKRNGTYYLSSYVGSHYDVFGKSKVKVNFKSSKEGVWWHAIKDSAATYVGGVSEVDFEMDNQGNFWAVGRLEDGDKTGFGTQIFYANKDSLSKWTYLPKALTEAHMSPRMFRHGEDIYLISRRQLGQKPFGRAKKILGMPLRRMINWVNYSLTPKTTALFKLNKQKKTLEWVTDLPGAGDTALPSVLRLSKDRFLVANYTSDPKHKNRSWLKGQFNPTYIYLQVLDFVKI